MLRPIMMENDHVVLLCGATCLFVRTHVVRPVMLEPDGCGATCHVGTGRMRCDLSCWNRTDVVRPIMLEPDVAWMSRTDFFVWFWDVLGGVQLHPQNQTLRTQRLVLGSFPQG